MTQTPFTRIVTAAARPFGGARRFAVQVGILSVAVAVGCWIAWPRSVPLPAVLLWPMPIMLGALIAYAAWTRSWMHLPPRDERRARATIAFMAGGMAGCLVITIAAGSTAPLSCATLLCLAQCLALAATTIDDGRS